VAVRAIVNHTLLLGPSGVGFTPHASESWSTMNRPRPCRLVAGGGGWAWAVPPPESVTSTRSVPPVSSTITSKGVRACWTAFIASSDTITDTTSRRSRVAAPIDARTNLRAAVMESGSGGKVRVVFMG
jgi:hypothetical protein